MNNDKVLKYEISERVMKNLMSFLDRVDYKGLTEVSVINEILVILNKPVKDEVKGEKNCNINENNGTNK
jgi:hypothetical protein